MSKKIHWEMSDKPCRLIAKAAGDEEAIQWNFISESDMVEIAEWCNQNQCGRRISYDTFQFKHKKQMSAFLLRWS